MIYSPLEGTDSDLLSHDGWELFPRPKDFFDSEEAYLEAIRQTAYRDPENVLAHEKAHMDTARAVGILSSQYGIERLSPNSPPHRAIMNLGAYENIPRLALASVHIAPIDPSETDLGALAEIGYRDVPIVGEKIRAWNDNNSLQIPIPHSLDHRAR
jgi:hypothetical protein